MNFKDLLKEDQKVFFNAEEMGEPHKVEEQNIICFLEDDNYSKKNENFGNFTENKILIVKESDYELINSPKFNSEIIIDDKVYNISNVKFNKGVVELKLSSENSW